MEEAVLVILGRSSNVFHGLNYKKMPLLSNVVSNSMNAAPKKDTNASFSPVPAVFAFEEVSRLKNLIIFLFFFQKKLNFLSFFKKL